MRILVKLWHETLNLFRIIGNWLLWLLPLAILLLALLLPIKLLHVDFLRFVEIVIWPFTALTILFFFKKIFTYLFFSMESFNFFGAKGNLEDINIVITREVERRHQQEKDELHAEEEYRKSEVLKLELQKKLEDSDKSKEESLELAKAIFQEWSKSGAASKKEIDSLKSENQQLRAELSTLAPKEVNSRIIDDNKETSDPPSEVDSDIQSLPHTEL